MNYLEIAEAYDAYANTLNLINSDVTAILELRERAAAAREAHRRIEEQIAFREFEYTTRRRYLDLEYRAVAARERQAEAMGRQADYYKQLTELMTVALRKKDAERRMNDVGFEEALVGGDRS